MNERLSKFLREINGSDVEEIYEWLDGNPDAIDEMKVVMAESHGELDVVRDITTSKPYRLPQYP